MNSLSTNVKQLNIFQKLRKRMFLLRKFDYERYKNAPEYIKLSDEFALKIPRDDSNNILYLDLIPEQKIPALLEKYIVNINDLTEQQKINILKREPQRCIDIEKEDLMHLVDLANKSNDYTFFNIINREKNIEIEYLMHLKENKTLDVIPNIMQYFSQNTIEQLLHQKPELINYLDEEKQKKHLQNRIEDFKYLNQESQIKYIRENLEYLQYANNEIQINMFMQDNSIFEKLSLDVKLETISNQPQMFEMIPYELKEYIYKNLQDERCAKVIRNLIYADIENVKLLSSAKIMESQIFLSSIFKDINEQDIEKIKEVFLNSKLLSAKGKVIPSFVVLHRGAAPESKLFIDDYSNEQVNIIKSLSIEQIKELINIDSNYGLAYLIGEDANIEMEEVLTEKSLEESKTTCKKLMQVLYGNKKSQELDESIELIYTMIKENIGKSASAIGSRFMDIHKKIFLGEMETEERKIESNPFELLKIILNKDIVMSNTAETIKQYIETQRENPESQEEFYEIMKNAYGDKALEILKSRPGLNVHTINSLEIFNENILNNFEIGFVHDLLSYNFRDFSSFMNIVKDESKLKIFKDYYYVLSEVLGQNAETMQKAISEYIFNEKLLQDTENKELTDKEYQSLISVLVSDKNPYNIRTLQELDRYEQISNEKIKRVLETLEKQIDFEGKKEKSEKHEIIKTIKKEICKYFMGIHYSEDKIDNYGTNIAYLCALYDIQSEKSKTEIYSNEEQEMLDIMHFIYKESDPEKLIELAEKFQEHEVAKNPLIAYQVAQKVEENELAIYNESLLTVEKMEELCSREENKSLIEKKIINGQTVYILEGIPFNILVHDSGNMNLEDLINYDGQLGNGVICSRNLSGAVLNKAHKKYDGGQWGTYGYTNVDGVMANNNMDASTDHFAKLIRTTGSISVKLNKEITEKDAETAFPRRYRSHKKISNANHGGKRLPDVYVSFINDASEDFESKISGPDKYGIPTVVIDLSKYVDRELDKEKTEERSDR